MFFYARDWFPFFSRSVWLLGNWRLSSKHSTKRRTKDKDKSPPTNPAYERPNRPDALLESGAFGRRIENVPDCVYRTLFQEVLPCMYFDIKCNLNVSFYHNTIQKPIKHMWDKSRSSIVIHNFASSSKFLLLSTTYREKVVRRSEIKSQAPCENECEKYCFNGGDCYHLADEGIVVCNSSWWYGGQRCEK